MYERVLVCLDGSERAEAVLPLIEQMAGPLDAEFILLRVVEPISPAEALASAGVVAPDALARESAAPASSVPNSSCARTNCERRNATSAAARSLPVNPAAAPGTIMDAYSPPAAKTVLAPDAAGRRRAMSRLTAGPFPSRPAAPAASAHIPTR